MTQHDLLPVVKNVCILCPLLKDPSKGVWYGGLINLVAVLAPLAEKVLLITGNFYENIPYDNVRVINIKAPMMGSSPRTLLARVFQYLATQCALSGALIRLSARTSIDTVFVFTGEGSAITTLVSKLLGKETILILRGYSRHRRLLRRLNLALTDKIITYSKVVVAQWGLEKYRAKVLIAPYLYVDGNEFQLEKPLSKRDKVVGYIGRLSKEKGIVNFMEALPEIAGTNHGVKCLIIGDGELQDKIGQYVKEHSLDNRVVLVGRVNRDYISGCLNQLKLLVIPSYSEGLPKIMLEAMACGTPVLATAVGSIPDIITDVETGFIMEDNSPECIASNVNRALNYSKIEEIARNARFFIENEFSYQVAVERYENILIGG